MCPSLDRIGEKLAAEHLSGRRVREVGSEDQLVRRARRAQSRPHERPQILRIWVGADRWDDHRDNPFAPLLVWRTENRDLIDRRMFDEDVLDLRWRDVLAATDDRVVGASVDEQVAV